MSKAPIDTIGKAKIEIRNQEIVDKWRPRFFVCFSIIAASFWLYFRALLPGFPIGWKAFFYSEACNVLYKIIIPVTGFIGAAILMYINAKIKPDKLLANSFLMKRYFKKPQKKPLKGFYLFVVVFEIAIWVNNLYKYW
jgi:hypothetical protein